MLRTDVTIDDFHPRAKIGLPGLLGLQVDALALGSMAMSMPIEAHHLAPNGFLHAASVIALADTACGFACVAHLPAGAVNFTTVELKSNFLGTATQGVIVAHATAVHLGRTTQVWDAVVRADGSDKPIALFRCTQMVLWPKA